MARFLALISRQLSLTEIQTRQVTQAAKAAGLDLKMEDARSRLFVDHGKALGDLGFVVGSIFAKDASDRQPVDPQAALMSRGQSLIDQHWGRYVGWLRDPQSGDILVVRDPTGSIGCLRWVSSDRILLASDITLLLAATAIHPRIDWDFVAQLAVFPHLRGYRTGLAGIDEVLPGSRLTIENGSMATESCWSPWCFTRPAIRIADAQEAQRRLRREIISVTAALVGKTGHPLLELSGGLDSSILAAALSAVGVRAQAVNLSTSDAEGDERRYARLVAERTGLPLVERTALGLESVDMGRPPRPHLDRPGSQAWLQVWHAQLMDVAGEQDCDMFVSGTGGDNVFCSLSSASPAADLFRTGRWRTAPAAISALATIHDASIWKVCGLAIQSALRRGPREIWPSDRSFVSTTSPGAPDPQPWLEEPDNVLPGSRAHVRSIFATYAHLGGSERDAMAPTLLPLLAQPIQELCLRIPSWLWVDGGRDRSIARAAFADLLPKEIIQRRTKGAVDSFCVRLVERNRVLLRSMLVDGHLAARGILDRAELAAWFDRPRAARDQRYFRILTLVDIEIWLRDWLGPT